MLVCGARPLRPCIDYLGVKKITVMNHYALPLITEFDWVKGLQIFTKLDLCGVYNVIN